MTGVQIRYFTDERFFWCFLVSTRHMIGYVYIKKENMCKGWVGNHIAHFVHNHICRPAVC